MSDVVIREGFLCPICMHDLGGVADLQKHFDESHAGEDKDVINQIKGLFGMAKRKLLKRDRENDDVSSAFSGEGSAPVSDTGTTNAGGIDHTMWDPQELGATRSYTDGFKRVRDARIDRFVVETNKLLIRLDKLISPDAPTEPNKRKAFDKAVVPWAPDSDVNLCTACGKSFRLTRRRHHCRLCGGIICNKCSQFLPFSYAKKLTNPAFQYEGEGFRRSSSSTSLNSILSPEGEGHIRTCEACRVLLERRDQQIEQRNRKPLIVQIYMKMKLYIEEADKVLPTFLEMAESLHSGETTYNIQEANLYRNKLAKLYENIDLLSKRIYTFGTNDAEPPTPTTLRLQKMVRSYASGYLQHNMMGLQALPSEPEILKIRERKRVEIQRRVDEERRLAAEREKLRKDDQKSKKSPERVTVRGETKPARNVPAAQGWVPQEIKTGNTDDPMIQQMNIIRGYVKQAKKAGKWDEVHMLEENLRDLQREYWKVEEQQRLSENNKLGRPPTYEYTSFDKLNKQPNRTRSSPEKQSTEHYNPFSIDVTGPLSEQRSNPQAPRQAPSKTSPSRTTPNTSPARSLPRNASPVKRPTPKTSPTNPFEDGEDSKSVSTESDRSSFIDDPTNPFSDNYSDQSIHSSQNPFS